MRVSNENSMIYLYKLSAIILSFFLSSCGIQINDGIIDNITNISSTNADDESDVDESSNSIDQTDDDDSSSGFGGGTHLGTTYTSGHLTLNTTINNAELDESWTPYWSDLVGYWKFNEATWDGTANQVLDSSGNNNHGTSSGEALSTTSSKLGDRAGSFDIDDDGTGDYVEITNESNFRPGSTSISISLWAYIPAVNTRAAILGKRQTSGDYEQYEIGIYSDGTGNSVGKKLVLTYRESSTRQRTYVSDVDVTSGSWAHIAMVADQAADTVKGYLNGVELSGTVNSVGAWPTINNSNPLQIGSTNDDTLAWTEKLDDVAIWFNRALSSDDIALIYSRQSAKFAGEMKSRIIDSTDSNSSWTNIEWMTSLPFGKELVSASDSEVSSNYSKIVGSTGATSDNNLMDGLQGLWHFNETSYNGTSDEVIDSSGNNNHAARNGDATTTPYGKFQSAATFDGSGDYLTLNSNIPDNFTQITVSAWVRSNSVDTTSSSHITTKYTNSANFNIRLLKHTNEVFELEINTTVTKVQIQSSTTYPTTEWVHVVAWYDGTEIRLYINGILDSTPAALTGTMYDASSFLNMGGNLDGQIDEVAMWNRALHDDEILQLYRRGANRIKYQVRSCASSDCSDQDAITPGKGWSGPGGNYLTYFSELYNNTSVTSSCTSAQECFANELSLDGSVNSASPSIPFNDFGTDGLVGLDNNRYFQYRTILESDDDNTRCDSDTTTCMPELKSVTIGPGHSYE